MKQDDNKSKKQDAEINLIKRLTTKQLVENQYDDRPRFATAQKRRLNELFKEEKENKNG